MEPSPERQCRAGGSLIGLADPARGLSRTARLEEAGEGPQRASGLGPGQGRWGEGRSGWGRAGQVWGPGRPEGPSSRPHPSPTLPFDTKWCWHHPRACQKCRPHPLRGAFEFTFQVILCAFQQQARGRPWPPSGAFTSQCRLTPGQGAKTAPCGQKPKT